MSVVDAHDTGVQKSDALFIRVIQELNDPLMRERKQDENFDIAVEFAILVLGTMFHGCYGITWDIYEDYELTHETASWVVLEEPDFSESCSGEGSYNKNLRTRILENRELKEQMEAEQDSAVQNAFYTEANGVKFACLTKGTVFVPVAKFAGLADMLVQWDAQQSCWSVQQIPLEKGSFGGKYTLQKTEHSGEIFVHQAGFIGKYLDDGENITISIKDIGEINLEVE